MSLHLARTRAATTVLAAALGLLVVVTATSAGCERVEQGAERVGDEARDALATGKAKAASAREEAERLLADELDRLKEQIRSLRARSADPSQKGSDALARLADKLEEKEKVARAKLSELRASSGEIWSRLLDEAQSETERLAKACRDAVSER